MKTRFGEEDNVELELELCLSLGGPFKKTDKSKRTDGHSDAVRCARVTDVNSDGGTRKRDLSAARRREAQHQKSGEERECKRIRTECNEILNGVVNGVDNGYGSGQDKDSSKAVTIGSPICSSSDISDSSSSRREGGSCDFGPNCDQTKPVNNIRTGTEETELSRGDSSGPVVVETKEWSNSGAIETGSEKPPKPSQNSNGSLLPFGQMPCVTSTGNGPEGKTVNGFLYRYSKSEISIICVCHGTSFSPAEFIIHAGGTNVSHPLRHITVIPSTF